jgi:hypothetical protein
MRLIGILAGGLLFVHAAGAVRAEEIPLPPEVRPRGDPVVGAYAHASGVGGAARELTLALVRQAGQFCPGHHLPYGVIGDIDRAGTWEADYYFTENRTAMYARNIFFVGVPGNEACQFEERHVRSVRIATYDGKRTRITELGGKSGQWSSRYVAGKRLYTSLRSDTPLADLSMLKDTGQHDRVAGYPCHVMRTVNGPAESELCVLDRGSRPPYIEDFVLREQSTMAKASEKGIMRVERLEFDVRIAPEVFNVPDGAQIVEAR